MRTDLVILAGKPPEGSGQPLSHPPGLRGHTGGSA